MGHFATGVTVITTKDQDGNPNGLTANAFMSLSLDPPLVLISVDKGAQCYACFNLQNGFTVNFLSEDQEEVSRRFATKGIDKFAGLRWHAGDNGAAILDSALGYVECRILNAMTVVIIPSLSAKLLTQMPRRTAVTFFQRKVPAAT